MTKQAISLLVFSALITGCAGGNGSSLPGAIQANSARSGITAQSAVVHGNFTEYTLPAGAHPSDFTRGPYSTLWFHSPPGQGTHAIAYRFSEGNGTTTAYTLGNMYPSYSTGITSTGGYVYFFADDPFYSENNVYLVRVNNAGTFTVYPDYQGDSPIFNLTVGSDGKLWYPFCVEACGQYGNGDYVAGTPVNSGSNLAVQLPGYTAQYVSPGPNGDIYATATNSAPPAGVQAAVFVISTSGKILHQFALPDDSVPFGIVTGSDHNLWIAESGTNKIAKMNPTTGATTQYSVPTAGAEPTVITYGYDLALWFVETHANKIARITTSGSVTEYSIPTANSGANAIQPCDTTTCSPHGGVWFTEQTANKIGKFKSPL
ncbi:MAG TPA: hypothetical protein VFE17_06700 [Candidatus Baltobacteraceae bacterium]|jgi:streptogramin lyase|nr:hypothetical protein [Candidatus Baltobacteraceae bacterium]